MDAPLNRQSGANQPGRVRYRKPVGRFILQQARIAMAVLLLLELVARLMGYGSRLTYDGSIDLLWAPRPNQRVKNNLTNRPVTIDANGLRFVPGCPAVPGHRLKVLCLGNSVTFGYSLADGETYEAILQRRLEELAPARWQVLNAGVNGYNLFFVRRRLVQLQKRGVHPDVIMLDFCFNESPHWPGEHFSRQEMQKILGGVRLKNFVRKSALFTFVMERVAKNRTFGLVNMLIPTRRTTRPPTEAAPGTTHAAPDARGESARSASVQDAWLEHYRLRADTTLADINRLGVRVLAVVWPDYMQAAMPYRDVFMEECNKAGVPYLDLQPLVEKRQVDDVFFDALHPEAAMVEREVDEAILPFFLEGTRGLDGR